MADREQRVKRKLVPVVFRGKGLSPDFAGAAWARLRDAAYEGRGA